MRYEIRLSGSGGQGLVLAGIILGEASAIYDGKSAVQTQSYGPEARGGMSKSEVIISDEEIDYPKAYNVDVLLSLTQPSFTRYSRDIKEGGLIIYDTDLVKEVTEGKYKLVGLPITATATNEVGRSMVANIVSLGAIVELTSIVTKDSIEKSLLSRVPHGTGDLNKKALYAGYDLAKKFVRS